MRTLLTSIGPIVETLEVLEEREKSFKVRNTYNKAECWLPKSGLKLRKPGVATYEDDYTIKPWFRAKMNQYQERALGILE